VQDEAQKIWFQVSGILQYKQLQNKTKQNTTKHNETKCFKLLSQKTAKKHITTNKLQLM
jgi:hypothetical protein